MGREPRIRYVGQLEESNIAAGVKYCAEPGITVVATDMVALAQTYVNTSSPRIKGSKGQHKKQAVGT